MIQVLKLLFFSVIGCLIMPVTAVGHTKWFVEYDLNSPPKKIKDMLLSYDFILFFSVTAVLVLVAVLIDGYFNKVRFSWLNKVKYSFAFSKNYLPLFLRFGTFVFMLFIAQMNGVYLTPELKTDAFWVSWVQLSIAVFLLNRRTQMISGFGILLLYSVAAYQYGFFHLLDYPIFLGVAVYLILDSTGKESVFVYRDIALRFSMAISLLWASIEKWAFPQWSFELLEKNPNIMLGMDFDTFMVVAGFVEFIAAFMLLAGQITARMASAVLLFFIVGAIPMFGMIDAIGHFEIIVVLIILLLSNNPLASFFLTRDKRFPGASGLYYHALSARISFTLIYYCLAVLGFCVAYYICFYIPHLYFQ